jgi:hypothetical protein
MRPPNPAPHWDINHNLRWENGYDHHPESIKLYKEMEDLDYKHNNDYHCFKSGGDGDNGEELMYLLDMLFERRDQRKKDESSSLRGQELDGPK